MNYQVSTTDLAAILGIAERTIGKLAEKKVLQREARGLFDLRTAVPAFVSYREGVVAVEGEGTEYGKWRTRRMREQALRAKIERQTLERTLLPADEVEKVWGNWTAMVRILCFRFGREDGSAFTRRSRG